MTEATGGDGRREMERTLVQRSLEDDSFRQSLLSDPRSAIEQAFGTELPGEGEIRVVEETADTVYVVLPARSAEVGAGELSDADLDAVAGGGGGSGNTGLTICQLSCITCPGACGI